MEHLRRGNADVDVLDGSGVAAALVDAAAGAVYNHVYYKGMITIVEKGPCNHVLRSTLDRNSEVQTRRRLLRVRTKWAVKTRIQ